MTAKTHSAISQYDWSPLNVESEDGFVSVPFTVVGSGVGVGVGIGLPDGVGVGKGLSDGVEV